MIPITPAEIRAILEVTDALRIHRESVVIPLARRGEGELRLVSGSKLEITAPENGLAGWLDALPGALGRLDLSGLKRIDPDD